MIWSKTLPFYEVCVHVWLRVLLHVFIFVYGGNFMSSTFWTLLLGHTEKSCFYIYKCHNIHYIYAFLWIPGGNGVQYITSVTAFPLQTFPHLFSCWLIINWSLCGGQFTNRPHLMSASGFSPTVCCPLSSVLQSARNDKSSSQRVLIGGSSRLIQRQGARWLIVFYREHYHSSQTQEGRQNFLAQEMETTTQARSIWLDSLKR